MYIDFLTLGKNAAINLSKNSAHAFVIKTVSAQVWKLQIKYIHKP